MKRTLLALGLLLGVGLVLTGCSSQELGATSKGSLALPSTATSTVSVGKTGKGKLCLYNGATFTVISFASGSTTPSYATSTTCQ